MSANVLVLGAGCSKLSCSLSGPVGVRATASPLGPAPLFAVRA